MKTLNYITLCMIGLFAMSSCTTEEYYVTEEYYNDVYKETWFADDFEIQKNHWNLIGDPDEIDSYYEYVFDKIPLEVSYYDGVVTAYIYFNYDTKDEIQTPLPYTEYKVYIDPETKVETYYSIQYSYDVKADGTIAFKAHVSDYFTSLFDPGTQYFRVAIVW